MNDLPSGWEHARLGDLCLPSQYGWTTSASTKRTDGLRFLRTTDITRGPINWDTVPYCANEPPDPSRYRLAPGDILISRAGSVGFSTYLDHAEPAVFASYLIRFRPVGGINGRYLAWFLNSPYYWAQIKKASSGITLANVNAKKLSAIDVPVAPVAEQGRIVAAIEEQLSRLDAGTAALGRARQKIRRMRAAVLEAAIRGRLLDAAETSVEDVHAFEEELPSGWSIAPVSDIAEVSGGIIKNPKRLPRNNPIPFLRVANVMRDQLDLREVHEIEVFDGELERLRLQRGDLLVVEGNGSPDQIGRSALWGGSIDPCVHQNHLIRVRPGNRIVPEYLNIFWNAPSSMTTIQAAASSTSGLHTLSSGKIRNIQVTLPPLPLQHQIIEEVDRQLSAISSLDQQLGIVQARGRALRAATLATAFSGYLAPQDAMDEPASVLLEQIAAARAASDVQKPRRGRKQAPVVREEVTT